MRLEERLQRQPVPLLGKVFGRKHPVEFADQFAHVVDCRRYQFNVDVCAPAHLVSPFGRRRCMRSAILFPATLVARRFERGLTYDKA